MKNNFVVNYQFSLDLNDNIDFYLYGFLFHLRSVHPEYSKSDILKQILLSSALQDESYMSIDDFASAFCGNSEVNENAYK